MVKVTLSGYQEYDQYDVRYIGCVVGVEEKNDRNKRGGQYSKMTKRRKLD